jgi:hypothetical protein
MEETYTNQREIEFLWNETLLYLSDAIELSFWQVIQFLQLQL